MTARRRLSSSSVFLLLAILSRPVAARMDIEDKGPQLLAGRFAMRITNVGVIGNAFRTVGRSFDPSFEFPRGSGHELLNHADLWVGALTESGARRVSGGPLLEWRPTLEPADTVREVQVGLTGTRSHFDDDGDGRIDEELVNGRDDDGDGLVDEDYLLPAQQMLTADYADDRPEAILYAYPTGERHEPLHLAVHQRAYAWSIPGHDGVAGIEFTITNQGTAMLRDVRVGLYADLDSREVGGTAGHLDDRMDLVQYSAILAPHTDTLAGNWVKECAEVVSGEAMMVRDANPASRAAGVAIVPLTHTTDVLGWFVNDAFPGVREARQRARAPRRDTTFQFYPYFTDAPPGQGGPPQLDQDRYAALAGQYPTAQLSPGHDQAVLVSCGPFPTLERGQSISVAFAFVGVPSPDSAARVVFDARMLYRGTLLNQQPDGQRGALSQGQTGINGHEACVEPPPGITFTYDPHCPQKLVRDPDIVPIDPDAVPPGTAAEVPYGSGHCVWTDLDCDLCTGDDGVDDIRRWEGDARLPPSPSVRTVAGDHRVSVEWNNGPECAIGTGLVGGADFQFAGYKVYRLDDWRRVSVLPEPKRWLRLAVFRPDTSDGGRQLRDVVDSTVAASGVCGGQPSYPVGRYRFVDDRALNGFDYLYVVTTILRERLGPSLTRAPLEFESPFFATFEDRTVPHATAHARARGVWVVPNPYRGKADWERTPVVSDPFTRHVDFMGLPQALCTIRIYTLAGDLVASIMHDGSHGDGQAAWNLISRNGQDVESGIYLFTISSALGHETGRFVIIR